MSAVVPFEPRKARTDADLLGAEITELCSYICAATCHLLDLIREFDERQYWGGAGFPFVCALAEFPLRHWQKRGPGKNSCRSRARRPASHTRCFCRGAGQLLEGARHHAHCRREQ